MIPRTLKNFSLQVDGRGYAGLISEIELPKLTIKTEEHRAGGMDMPIELDMGMEKLECSLTFAEYNEELFKLFGLAENAPVALSLRGAISDENGTITKIVISVQGRWRELDSGTWKPAEKTNLKVMVAARYYKLEMGDSTLIEIDAENMIRTIAGVDQLAELRTAIGL